LVVSFTPFPEGSFHLEPGQDEHKDKVPRTAEKQAKPRRFRIVKLEERIAPGGGHGNGSNYCLRHTYSYYCY
jgi:hypothetical protein